MRIAYQIFFIFATLIHHSAATCGGGGEYIWDGSIETSIPTNNTEFQYKLNLVLDDLPTNKTKISLYAWVGVYNGDYPNTAYSQARCIGYVDYTTCHDCIQKATDVLRNDCSSKAFSAILWYGDYCMVRYSNHKMYGLMQMPDNMIRFKTTSGYSSSPKVFNDARAQLLDELSSRAQGYPDGYQMLSAGKRYDYSSKVMIYGAAQCSSDLYSSQCNDCLAIVQQKLVDKFDGKLGGSIVGPSCNFRYEIYPFINSTFFLDLSPSIPPPPPPSVVIYPPSPWVFYPPSPQFFYPPYTDIFYPPFTGSNKAPSAKALSTLYIVFPLIILSII